MVALRNFSASQVVAFKNCKRLWFLNWILKLRGEESPAQKRGVEIHSILEHYLRTGKILPAFQVDPAKYEEHDLGYERYIEWCLPYLPKHTEEHLSIEQQIFLDTPSGRCIGGYDEAEGVPLTGYIDMGLWGRDVPEIWDLKTTSNLRYVKTPEECHRDVQLNTYARWVFSVEPSLQEVKCGLLYVKVEGPGKKAPQTARVKSKKVIPVITTISRQSNEEYWERDALVMQEMIDLAGEANEDDVRAFLAYQRLLAEHAASEEPGEPPAKTQGVLNAEEFLQSIDPSVNHCGNFGGCAHRAQPCGVSVQETLYQLPKTKKGKISMGFLDKVKAKRAEEAQAGGGAELTQAAETPASTKVAAPKKSAAELFKNRVKRKTAAEDEGVEAKADDAPKAPKTQAKFSFGKGKAKGDSPAPTEEPQEPAEPVVAKGTDVLPPDAPSRTTTDERGAELRGEAQEKVDKAEKKKAAKKTKKSSKRTFTLYLNCMPLKGEHQSFVTMEDWTRDLVDSLNAQVKEHADVADYRLLGFAEEKVALAQAVQERIDAGEVPDVLVCLTGGQNREVANLLMPLASDIVGALK